MTDNPLKLVFDVLTRIADSLESIEDMMYDNLVATGVYEGEGNETEQVVVEDTEVPVPKQTPPTVITSVVNRKELGLKPVE